MSSKDFKPVHVETDGWGKGKVTVGETDLTPSVQRVELDVRGGALPTVTLHMITGKLAAELADADVKVDPATAAALVGLGWTPPLAGSAWRSVDTDGTLPIEDQGAALVASIPAAFAEGDEVVWTREGHQFPATVDSVSLIVRSQGHRFSVQPDELAHVIKPGDFNGEWHTCETVLSWHPTDGSDSVEIPLGEPWVLPGTDVSVGEFRLSTREVPDGEVSGG